MELVCAPVEKCQVVTRAQIQQQHAEEEREKKLYESSGVALNTIELEDKAESMFQFDNDLFHKVKGN